MRSGSSPGGVQRRADRLGPHVRGHRRYARRSPLAAATGVNALLRGCRRGDVKPARRGREAGHHGDVRRRRAAAAAHALGGRSLRRWSRLPDGEKRHLAVEPWHPNQSPGGMWSRTRRRSGRHRRRHRGGRGRAACWAGRDDRVSWPARVDRHARRPAGTRRARINPVPRAMITAAVRARPATGRCASRSVSRAGGRSPHARSTAPGDRRRPVHLGTSGGSSPSRRRVAAVALAAVDIAWRMDADTVYLTQGVRRACRATTCSAAETQDRQCSNFVGDLLTLCRPGGSRTSVLVGHVGKLVKVGGRGLEHAQPDGRRAPETVAALAARQGRTAAGAALLACPHEAAVELLSDAGLADVWDDVPHARRSGTGSRGGRRAGGVAPPDCEARSRLIGAVIGSSRSPTNGRPYRGHDASLAVKGRPASPHGRRRGAGSRRVAQSVAWRAIAAPTGRRRAPAARPFPGCGRTDRDRRDMQAVVVALERAPATASSARAATPGLRCRRHLRRLLPDAGSPQCRGSARSSSAAARLGRPWNDVRFASAHGLDVRGGGRRLRTPSVLALSDARRAAAIAAPWSRRDPRLPDRSGTLGREGPSGSLAVTPGRSRRRSSTASRRIHRAQEPA